MGNRFRVVLLLLLFLVTACEEEEDCVGCNLNPKIKLKFEATGSKIHADSILKAVNFKIGILIDSLLSEGLTEDQRNQLLVELEILRNDSVKYHSTSTLFKSGKVNIEQINASEALDPILFQDTIIRDFAIPVDMHHDTSTFIFTYHDKVDTLQIYYLREIKQNLDGIRMSLHGIEVNQELSTFDSVKVRCYSSDCSTDITKIFVYF